jgi:hypothetical protein
VGKKLCARSAEHHSDRVHEYDNAWGTPGQLVGGTVEVQVAETLLREWFNGEGSSMTPGMHFDLLNQLPPQ